LLSSLVLVTEGGGRGKDGRDYADKRGKNRTRTLRYKTRHKPKIPFVANRVLNPAKAAAAYTSILNDNDSSFQQSRITAEEEARKRLEAEEDFCGVKGVRDWDECERNWRHATEGLVGVKEGIGATGARLVQARDVAGYLEEKTVR
jgi:hypothetical protein